MIRATRDSMLGAIPERAFFDLQIRFAQRVRALSGLPLARALLDYTNLYVRFGLGREFDEAHPGWRRYLAGLRAAADPLDWTYRFYLADAESSTAPAVSATVGCFSYAILESGDVRLHFRNAEPSGRSPLSAACRARRVAELRELAGRLAREVDGAASVRGVSWLYNLDAYRRLFPPSYVASARVASNRFRSMPLWGQFLDRGGRVRAAGRAAFLAALAEVSSIAQLEDCFPLRALAVRAPARAFFERDRG